MNITLILFTLIAFSAICFLCFKTLVSDTSKSEKIISIATVLLMLCLLIGTLIAAKESIKYETMNDYFEGKIEITERVDTIRTFKFN